MSSVQSLLTSFLVAIWVPLPSQPERTSGTDALDIVIAQCGRMQFGILEYFTLVFFSNYLNRFFFLSVSVWVLFIFFFLSFTECVNQNYQKKQKSKEDKNILSYSADFQSLVPFFAPGNRPLSHTCRVFPRRLKCLIFNSILHLEEVTFKGKATIMLPF